MRDQDPADRTRRRAGSHRLAGHRAAPEEGAGEGREPPRRKERQERKSKINFSLLAFLAFLASWRFSPSRPTSRNEKQGSSCIDVAKCLGVAEGSALIRKRLT